MTRDEEILRLKQREQQLAEEMMHATTQLAQLATMEMPESERLVRVTALEGQRDVAGDELRATLQERAALEQERTPAEPAPDASPAPIESPDERARAEEADRLLREQAQARLAALGELAQATPPVQTEVRLPGPQEAPQLVDPGAAASVELGAVVAAAYVADRMPSVADVTQTAAELAKAAGEVGLQVAESLSLRQDQRIEQKVHEHEQPAHTELENALREMSRQEDVRREQQRHEQGEERRGLEARVALLQRRFDERQVPTEQRAELQAQLDAQFQQLREQLERQQEEERQRLREELERKREHDALER